ncbi:lipoyl synthase [Clostridium sp. HV4-5-A1G]|uniref:lipoyl synthase n=1 Tax=Clostridium sp. HV4-5-A1G TaxID=2004595 RepID=UPI00123B067A|nr:lipoyl synthase [Clostridium sp. HV4-5-A1G]KAA8679084.1 lipoyl synthase [Clostridium sp. HV4-5-A1G]
MIDKKPDWLKITYRDTPNREYVEKILKSLSLNAVCTEANCPNYLECFNRKTATFMILGINCTRNCRFCNVTFGKPDPIDVNEPENVAKAVAQLGLKYVVITSVTRDDLNDGGAEHFAQVVKWIRKLSPSTKTEVLIPDLKGDVDSLKIITQVSPVVIGHNIETVPRLYSEVRPQAIYKRSLEVIKNVKFLNPSIYSKSSIMLGLGETRGEVIRTFKDLRDAGCEILTIGQYLSPSKYHHAVVEYVEPKTFREYKDLALEMGFTYVASAPYVRSSYHADEAMNYKIGELFTKNNDDIWV